MANRTNNILEKYTHLTRGCRRKKNSNWSTFSKNLVGQTTMWTNISEKMRFRNPILRLFMNFWYVALIILVIIAVASAIVFSRSSKNEAQIDLWTPNESLIFAHTVSSSLSIVSISLHVSMIFESLINLRFVDMVIGILIHLLKMMNGPIQYIGPVDFHNWQK